MKKIIAMALCLLLALGCVAFAEGAPEETGTLTIYYTLTPPSGRDPIIEQFQEATGIKCELVQAAPPTCSPR